MPYWEQLGRSVVFRGTADQCEHLIQHLNFAGFEPSAALDSETNEYLITVPQAQREATERLIFNLNSAEVRDQDIQAYERATKAACPQYVTAEERFSNSTASAIRFLIASGVVFGIAIIEAATYFYREHDRAHILSLLLLIAGSILLLLGILNLIKAFQLREKIAAENIFTLHVVEWCISTYPPRYIDHTIRADSRPIPVTYDSIRSRRKELLRRYITREFIIEDTLYLQYLIDETYSSIFEKKMLREAKSPDFFKLFTKRSH